MNLAYEMRHGSYYLVDFDEKPSLLTGEREIHLMTDEVAICFDRDCGTLLKHGSPATIEAWCVEKSKKYRDAGLHDVADSMIVLSGAFPVEEINKCLSITGYCKRFMEKMDSMIPAKST